MTHHNSKEATMPGQPNPKALVSDILRRLPQVQAIYLHGSRALGQASQNSDLDLALLSSSKIPPLQLWETAQHLAALLGMDVDLLDLRQASTVMQMQVITRGERLYCKDEAACGAFEDLVFSMYARLNEERAGILQDIAQRGSIYG